MSGYSDATLASFRMPHVHVADAATGKELCAYYLEVMRALMLVIMQI